MPSFIDLTNHIILCGPLHLNLPYSCGTTPHWVLKIAPIGIFASTSFADYLVLQQAQVWGSPSHVLEPSLQHGCCIPCWEPWTCWGQYLGFSPSHACTVSRFLNLNTSSVLPQYHVVLDNAFSTVPNAESGDVICFQLTWPRILKSGHWIKYFKLVSKTVFLVFYLKSFCSKEKTGLAKW